MPLFWRRSPGGSVRSCELPRRAKQLTVEEADQRIRALVKKREWHGPEWHERAAIADGMPAGVPSLPKLVARYSVDELWQLPAHADDAIIAALETRPRDPDAAFVRTAMAITKGDPRKRLRNALALRDSLVWASNAKRTALHALVAKRPEVVEGARAAMALTKWDYRVVTSVYLPILVADATADSFDLLIPQLERIVKKKDGDLDWFRKKLVPLMGDTAQARSVIELLAKATDERTAKSPALAFARQLGFTTKLLQLSLTFRDKRKRTAYQIRIDSTQSLWLKHRPNEKWQWRHADPEDLKVPATATEYVLRVSQGDRKKLGAWAQALFDSAGT